MKVKVLRAGRYLNQNGRSVFYEAGDEFEPQAGGYDQIIVNNGHVEQIGASHFTSSSDEELNEELSNDPIRDVDLDRAEDDEDDEGHEDGESFSSSLLDDEPSPSSGSYEPDGRLMELKGVGAKTADSLLDAGYPSLRSIIEADPVDLADTMGEKITTVQAWQAQATDLLKE